MAAKNAAALDGDERIGGRIGGKDTMDTSVIGVVCIFCFVSQEVIVTLSEIHGGVSLSDEGTGIGRRAMRFEKVKGRMI